MSRNVRLFFIALIVGLFSHLAIANFFDEETRRASPLLPDTGLRLGLDLQGGIHWVLGVQLDVTEERELRYQGEGIAEIAEEDGWSLSTWGVDGDVVRFEGVSEPGMAAIREWVSDHGGLTLYEPGGRVA